MLHLHHSMHRWTSCVSMGDDVEALSVSLCRGVGAQECVCDGPVLQPGHLGLWVAWYCCLRFYAHTSPRGGATLSTRWWYNVKHHVKHESDFAEQEHPDEESEQVVACRAVEVMHCGVCVR